VRSLSNNQARRIALAAQGFASPRPVGRIDRRHFRKVIAQVGVLQLDSVNVLQRSHYLPMWSRLGSYSIEALDDYTAHSGEMFEYWGHVASLLPVELYPLLRWRMDAIEAGPRTLQIIREHPEYIDMVYDEIAVHGPLTVSDLSDPGARTGPWWGHGKGKIALDWLFSKGKIASYRNGNFGRLYDLPERVIPAEHLDAPKVQRLEAFRRLLLLSARHHGVGTAADLADYYRLHLPTARGVLAELSSAGELEEVEVEGWSHTAYLHPAAHLPRRATGTALLTPFDSLIWERDRIARLFGFFYRIEIYVPERDRVYGYYVLPFLMDGELVARVDLKADRKDGRLLVQAAHLEPERDPNRVAGALAVELEAMGRWLGLAEVAVSQRGNLAGSLRAQG
jgi:uncharacterized protein YcaQ